MENGSGGYMGGELATLSSIMPIKMGMRPDMEFYGGERSGISGFVDH